MNGIRILADDLTGALDSAAAFAGGVPVYFDVPASGASAPLAVSAVATGTRDVALEALPGLLAPSLPWLGDAALAFKKVDSLLRGNSFAEIAYVARAAAFRKIVFAPAFPQQGRVTADGRQWVIAPGASFAERKPVGAGTPADAFAVLGLEVVAADAAPGDRLSVWIPEVRCDDDLARVAALSIAGDTGGWLWCGSAGLAHAIATVHGRAPDASSVGFLDSKPGPVLLVSASHHPVVHQQWDLLKAAERGAIMALHGQPTRLRAAFRAMGQPFDIALFDLSPTRVLAPPEAAALLARQVDQIVGAAPQPAAVVVVGGDTLRALCRAAGVRALTAHPAVRAGWGCARFEGGCWDGVPCYSRSGAFGDPDDLTTMLRQIARRAATRKEPAT